jgi:hypothetical protein
MLSYEIGWRVFRAGFLPDETSTQSFRPPDMDQAFGGIAVAQIKGWME